MLTTEIVVRWRVTPPPRTDANPATAPDFARASGMVTAASGQAPAIPIHALRDVLAEGNEQFRSNLDGASGERPGGGGVAVAGRSLGVSTIPWNLEGRLPVVVERSSQRGVEGATLPVTLLLPEEFWEIPDWVATGTVTVATAPPATTFGIDVASSDDVRPRAPPFRLGIGVASSDDVRPRTSPFRLGIGVAAETTVEMAIADDDVYEDDETFTLNLLQTARERANAITATTQARISDGDPVTMGLERAAYTIEEGKTTQVCVVAPHPARIERDDFYLSLTTTATGSAVADSHYAAFSDRPVGPFSGTTRRACTDVEALVNLHDSGVEDFSLELKKPAGLARVEISTASAAMTITKGDVVVAALSRESRFGGAVTDESEHSIILHVLLLDTDGRKNPIQSPWREGAIIEYRLSGTARGGAQTDADRDYAVFHIPPDVPYQPDARSFDLASSTGTLPINVASQRGEIILDVHDDNRNEDDEQVTIELLRVVTGSSRIRIFDHVSKTATTTILDNDPIVVRVYPPPPATEGTAAEYAVSLGAVPTRPVRVPYLVTTSTETTTPRAAPQDFVGPFPRAGVLVFTADDFATRTVSVPVSHDGLMEDAEYFHLVVTQGAITGSYGRARVPTTRSETTILASNQLNVKASVLPNVLLTSDYSEFLLASLSLVDLTIELTDADGNLTAPPAPVAIAYRLSGTATGGAARGPGIDYHYTFDYDEAASSGVAVITPSDRFPGRAFLPLAIEADLVNEASEEAGIELVEVVMGASLVVWPTPTPSASFTILDYDSIRYEVVVDRARVAEASAAVARFTLEFRENNPRYGLLRSAGDIELPYTITGSATYGEDYTAGVPRSGMMRLAAGETSASFDVMIVDDDDNESAETIIVSLGEAPTIGAGAGIVSRSATRGLATTTIGGSDATVFRVSPSTSGYTVRDGEQAVFRVAASGGLPSAPTTLAWSVVGGDAPPADAADYFVATSGATRLAAGVTTTEIRIGVRLRGADDATRSFVWRLDSAVGGRSSRDGALIGSPSSAAVSVSGGAIDRLRVEVEALAPTSVSEGGTASFRIRLNGVAGAATPPPRRVVVEYTLSSGTAVGGATGDAERDYTWPAGYDAAASTGTVTILPTVASATVSLAIADDALTEGAERIVIRPLRVTAGARAVEEIAPNTSASIVILASDQLNVKASVLPDVLLTSDYSEFFLASLSLVDLTIELTDADGNLTAPPAPVAIAYRLSGTATGGAARGPGIDYHYTFDYDEAASSGVAVITPSDLFPGRAFLPLAIEADLVNEASEEAGIELVEVVMGASLVVWPTPTPSASFTILDYDSIRYEVVVDRARVAEASAAVARFTLEFRENNPRYGLLRSAGDIELPYTITGSATYGEDYTAGVPRSGMMRLAAGETSASFDVMIVDDDDNESAETIIVSLGEAPTIGAGAGIVSRSATRGLATTTIGGSDATVFRVSPSTSGYAVRDGEQAVFRVAASGGLPSAPTTLAWSVVGGDVPPADAADYFVATSGATRLAAGVTTTEIRIGVRLRGADDATRSFVWRLDSAVGGRSSRDGALIGSPSSAAVSVIGGQSREAAATTVRVKVYLQGAFEFNPSTDTMKTPYVHHLPARQPYNVRPWYHGATTTIPHLEPDPGFEFAYGVATATDVAVDWVLVDLRVVAKGAGPFAARPRAPMADRRRTVQAGLLLSDGIIAGVDEDAATVADAIITEGVRFDVSIDDASESLYVVIHHRNHLPIGSAGPVTGADCIADTADYCVDFTMHQSHQFTLTDLGHGRLGMRAGDINRSGTISLADRYFVVIHSGRDIQSYAYRDPDAGSNYIVDGDLNFSRTVSLADRALVVINSGNDTCTFCAPNP